jgi:hypothetical protein
MKATKPKPYWIVVKFVQGPNQGRCRIWKDYDKTHTWGSPLYEIQGYADSHVDAKKIVDALK